MKSVLQKCPVKRFLVMLCIAILSVNAVQAQTCPQPITTTITSFSNTYYPGQQAAVSAGSTAVGPASAQDFVMVSPTDGSTVGFHASKGEGIAGTPRFINLNNYGSLQKNIAEGYPGGSFGMGAPGNAGGCRLGAHLLGQCFQHFKRYVITM